MSELPADIIAKLGLGAATMIRAVEILGGASTPEEGRAAMSEAADVLAELTPDSPLIARLRDTSDLDDSHIVGLCQQMAMSLAGQAEALTQEVQRQTDRLKNDG